MKFKLILEDIDAEEKVDLGDINIYQDSTTHKYYYYNGDKLVEIKPKKIDKLFRKIESEKRVDTESPKAKEARLARIKKGLEDKDTLLKGYMDEIDDVADFDYEADKPVLSPRNAKLQEIRDSIEDFVAEQTGLSLGKKFSKRRGIDPTILRREDRYVHKYDKPVVNVYFDRSGSWSGREDKSSLGWDAISVLQEFEQMDAIELNVFYFAVGVWRDEKKALREINNSGEEIVQHVIKSAPDNIVLMTDNDLLYNDAGHTLTSIYHAPGAVWGIFLDTSSSVAEKIMKHFVGDSLNKTFLFGHDY